MSVRDQRCPLVGETSVQATFLHGRRRVATVDIADKEKLDILQVASVKAFLSFYFQYLTTVFWK